MKTFREWLALVEGEHNDLYFVQPDGTWKRNGDGRSPGVLKKDLPKGAIISEASRLASAVRLDEIPQKYRHLKVLGRGTTSIAVDFDEDHVLLFTRDQIKFEWLRDQGLATYVEEFISTKNHIRGMHELPILVLKARKLYPLSKENRSLARKISNEFREVRLNNAGKRPNDVLLDLYNHFSGSEERFPQLREFLDFIVNYGANTFHFDIGIRNFMQTKDGELVLLDPIVSADLLALIRK